ncbi:MAG: RuBisCO large subunit C-terminal-like domain-containing protein [Nitrospirota bacterium]
MPTSDPLGISGERFTVRYHLDGPEREARALATAIGIEQTVELPEAAIPEGPIRDRLVGRLDSFKPLPSGRFEAAISYAIELVAGELPQFLNVAYGTISLKRGVRVGGLDLPPGGFAWLRGPRFGTAGLRDLLGVPDRPLLGTVVKPIGLSAEELADLAYQFALGGMDFIKDDSVLTDQPFAPFAERVARCAEAVARAGRETGRRCLYVPNVTAPAPLVGERARTAKRAGAGGLMLAPGLAGWDALRTLAADEHLGLPVVMHPAWLGPSVAHEAGGLAPSVLFGRLPRLAGADACIFPTYGSRFSFTPEECREIASGLRDGFGTLKPSLPIVGGGVTVERVPELCRFYGNDVLLLLGGALRLRGPDLVRSCRECADLVARSATAPGRPSPSSS